MMQANKIKRFKIIFLSLLALVLAMSFAMSNTKTEATSSVVFGNRTEDSEQPQAQQEKKKQTTKNSRNVRCVICHTRSKSMHFDGDEELDIGSADCNGGDPTETTNKYTAHVLPRDRKPDETDNPTRTNADWNRESDE